MFAKITTGSLAAGLINYMDNVKEKDARILIAKGLCTASHEAICASFEIQASRNHTVSEKMLHIALAFSEKDSHRTKSDEFMTAFALDYLKRMGHDYDHIHMALNIIGDDGKPLDMKFYKTRSQRICYKMTKEYGLYFAKDKKKVNRYALKGKDKLKYEVADAAMPLLGTCKSLKAFREALAKKGIRTTIVPTRDGKGLGIVYTITDKRFSIGGAKCDQSLKFSALEKIMEVSTDEDVQEFRGGQYVRPAEGKLTERLSNEQFYEPVYGDDFSDSITEMSYEEFVKEREKDWGDPNDAFDMSNTSAPQEDSHIASNIAAAAVELATGGTQIAPASGDGAGNDDEWWERERQRARQNEYQPRRKGRH
ncbi:MAG: Relaxase/mobilization nuclease [bacterium P201]|nr:MAG: Relaxase/mobilization nuclease [bacterium P201]